MKRTLLFILLSVVHGTLLAQTVTKIQDINHTGEIVPNEFIEVNGKTLFFADGPYGIELYTTDGTNAGTTLVKDVNPFGNAFNYTYSLRSAILGNKVYFFLDNGIDGAELWASDGTNAGTVMIKNINDTPNRGQDLNNFLIELNNKIYFPANDGKNGSELWVSDGTSAGTYMVKNINPAGTGVEGPFAIAFNGELYFQGGTGTYRDDLWKTDGTSNGTVLVKDFNSGNPQSSIDYTIYNNSLYFILYDYNSSALWKTNGDAASTTLIKLGANKIFNSIANGLIIGVNVNEIWITDETSTSTLLKTINSNGYGLFSTQEFIVVNNILFFTANDGVHGHELWKCDGTIIGTDIVKDIDPTSNSYCHALTSFNNQLIFAANDGINGSEMWISDGTASGTQMITNFNSIGCLLTNDFFIHNNSTLYFGASDDINLVELWKYEINSTTSVLGINNNNTLYPAPNPTQDKSTITLNNPTLVNQVNITNAQGVVVQNNVINTNLAEINIDLGNEKAGIYFIQVITGSGELMNCKVVKY